MKQVLLLTLLFTLASHSLFAQQPSELQPAAARIAGSILVGGHTMEYERGLADGFGGRLTGSPAYSRAAEWAAAQFKAAGIKNVKLEPFTIPNGWERGWATGRIVSPVERRLSVESLGWTPSTPAGGVKGEIVFVSDISAQGIKSQADKIKGHIVYLDLEGIFASAGDSQWGTISRLLASYPLMKDAGAIAVLWPDSSANNTLNAHSPSWDARVIDLPAAQIGMEDAKFIKRLMEKGPVTIEFNYQNRITGPTQVNNVIAEIPGREKPDEWVIIGAHLDSWDYGTGAQDNGSGIAMVMEAARAIAALGTPPRRSIRFALWGGEEQGLLGSTAYVRAHASEMGKCVAALNTDNGAGHPKGWKVEGRSDLENALRPISTALLADLSADGISQQISFDTDHGPFMLEGVPSLDLWVDMSKYGEVHHKSSDTIDKINAHNLADGAAVVAVTAYVIAERAEPIAPRLDRTATAEILKKAKLDAFLTDIGAWK
jgi:carboxypeptidase Q